jgi:hypothetical protein
LLWFKIGIIHGVHPETGTLLNQVNSLIKKFRAQVYTFQSSISAGKPKVKTVQRWLAASTPSTGSKPPLPLHAVLREYYLYTYGGDSITLHLPLSTNRLPD